MRNRRCFTRWSLALGMVWTMLAGPDVFAGVDTWTLLGPTTLSSDQTIRTIAVHPTDSLIIYAGNDTATVYKTTNGGTSWTALSVDPTRTALHIEAMLLVPTSPDSIFAATDSSMIYRSINAGLAWTRLTTGFVDSVTNSIVMNPDAHSILYTGTRKGVYKTLNFGDTWFPMNSGLGADSSNVTVVTIDEDNPDILYVGTSSGNVYRSDNAGGVWTNVSSVSASIEDIKVDVSNPIEVYVATQDSGVFYSTDRGVSFSERNTDLTVPPLYLPLTVLSLAIDTSGTNSKVYAGTQNNGVFLYDVIDTTWTPINSGLTSGIIHSLTVNPSNTAHVYAGTQAQGIHSYLGNREPVMNTIGDHRVNSGEELTFTVTATDPDGNVETQALSYGVSDMPLGATFDSLASRVFAWTPADTQTGLDTLVFRVWDARGGLDSQTVVLTVNQNPVLTAIGDQTAPENEVFTLTVVATDADGDSVFYTTSTVLPDGSTEILPAGATFDTVGGVFTWTPPYSTVSRLQADQVFTITFSAHDTSGGQITETIALTVTDNNQSPVFVGLPALVSVNEGQAMEVDVRASDGDLDDLTYGTVGGLPAGAGFDSVETHQFTWIPSYADSGAYEIVFSVSDGRGGVGQDTMNVNVRDLNQLPQLGALADSFFVDFGDSLYVSILGTDADDDSLVYNAAGLPVGAALVEADSGKILRWIPNIDQHGNFTITVNVEDKRGGSDFHELVVIVNSAPAFVASPGNLEITEGDTVSFSLLATDRDSDALTYTVEDAPDGAVITTTDSIVFEWITTSDDQGTYAPVFRVSDGRSGMAEQQVQIKVLNINRPPVFTPVVDQVIQPGGSVSFTVTANDPDNQMITYEATGMPTGATFDAASRVFFWDVPVGMSSIDTVLFIAMDPDSSRDSMSVQLTISDVNVVPVMSSIDDKTVGEGELLNFAVVAADGNADTLTYSVVGALPSGAVFDADAQPVPLFRWTPDFGLSGSSFIVQFSADDGRGGTDMVSVKISVSNVNRTPTLTLFDTTLAENQPLTMPLGAGDLDNDPLSVSIAGLPEGAIIDSTGSFSVQWTPTFLQEGIYSMTVTLTDTAGGQVSEEVSVTVTNLNRVPGNIVQIFPIKGEEVTLSDYLIWSRSVDPDADDDITYELVFDNTPGFTSPELVVQDISASPFTAKASAGAKFYGVRAVQMQQLITDAQNNGIETIALQLGTISGIETLADDVVYHWRLRAKDNRGGTSSYTAAGASLFFNSNNSAPKTITGGFSPVGGIVQTTQSPQITWHPSEDPDLSDEPETLMYEIELNSGEDFSEDVEERYTTELGANVVTVAANLADNAQWFYRIRAIDDGGATSPWSDVQSFYVDTQPEPPLAFSLQFPQNDAHFLPVPAEVAFRWLPTTDPDPMATFTYTLEVATEETFDEFAIVHRTVEIDALEANLTVATADLPDGVYYWRVIATDNQGLTRPSDQHWMLRLGEVTGIEDFTGNAGVPTDFTLAQNYPNPFNPRTTIRYGLPRAADVRLSIFNVLGQLVDVRDFGLQSAGWHRLEWDGRDRSGITMPSGLYIYRIEAGAYISARTMLMLK
jgi:hypothetical protein